MNKQLPRDSDGKLLSHAWPGGYPIYYITRDGLTVCPTCGNKEVDISQEVIDGGINYEDTALYCDDCSERIEAAYE